MVAIWLLIFVLAFVIGYAGSYQAGKIIARRNEKKAILAMRRRSLNTSESLVDGIDLGHYKPLVDDLFRNIAELTKAGFTQNDEQISSRHAAVREIIRKRKEEIRQDALAGRTDLVQAQLLGIEIKPEATKYDGPNNFGRVVVDDIHVDERIIPVRKYTSKELDRYDRHKRIAESAKREKERLQKKIADEKKDTDWVEGETVVSVIYSGTSGIYFVKTLRPSGKYIQRAISQDMWMDIKTQYLVNDVYRTTKRYSLRDDPCSCGVDDCDGF